MKSFFAAMLLCALASTHVLAESFDYDLEVDGMKCAYCAYNVSKQLASLDGVVSNSVNVDLEQGRVTLRSAKTLPRAQMADLLLQAGFELNNVAEVVSTTPPPQREGRQVLMSVNLNSARIGNGEFDVLLEALGTIAAEQSSEISIVAPNELETAILKPVLAGRRTVIKVDYESARYDADTVIRINSASSDQ